MDSPREEFPRVSVDTQQDWQRIRANFTQAVYARLDERLALNNLTGQRSLFADHAQQLINATFDIARANVRVNGRNLEDLNGDGREVEIFDEALDRRIWSLSDQRLISDREIAIKRRTRPQEVVTLLEDLLQRQQAEADDTNEEPGEEDDQTDQPHVDERLVEAESTFKDLSSLSEGLQQTAQTQLERSKRLRSADKEIRALKT